MDFENLPKANQIIFTLDTICDPNIITLSKACLRYFVHKLQLAYNGKTEKENNSFMDLEILTES